MFRYLRLYLYFLRFSFSKAMEFRMDFYFRVVMDCVFYVVNIAFFRVIYLHTPELGGWNVDQMMIFVSGYLLTDAIHMTFFSNNLWFLPSQINRGDLDYYVVRPVSSLFFLSLRDFAANSFMNLAISTGIVVWALARYPGELGAFNIGLYVMMLILGNVIWGMMHIIFIIPTFWLHSNMGLREILFNLNRYMERPDQIFSPWIRRTITSILPLALVVSYPTHMLFEGFTLARFVNVVLVVAGVFAFMVWFWNRGMRAYTSASS